MQANRTGIEAISPRFLFWPIQKTPGFEALGCKSDNAAKNGRIAVFSVTRDLL
jgi:hypothetical protein